MQLDFAVVAFYIVKQNKLDDTILAAWMLSEAEQGNKSIGVTSRITRRGDTWNMHITHPDGSVDRIKMDWSNTQGPMLI